MMMVSLKTGLLYRQHKPEVSIVRPWHQYLNCFGKCPPDLPMDIYITPTKLKPEKLLFFSLFLICFYYSVSKVRKQKTETDIFC